MNVYYGFSYLTPKAVRKAELAIYFENTTHNPVKNEEWVKRRMKIVHTRPQTKEERGDAYMYTRTFTKYSYFIDEKPYFGDIDKVLETNLIADKNHVSEEEREEIKSKLRSEYFKFFNRKTY